MDRVSQGAESQESVYVESAIPTVRSFLAGSSACLFVYGQTGSGKTHTMFGDENVLDETHIRQLYTDGLNGLNGPIGGGSGSSTIHTHAGIVPRVLVDVMSTIRQSTFVDATVTASYVGVVAWDEG